MPPRLRHLSHYVYTTVYCICSSTLISDGTLEIHLFSHSISCDFQREKDFQCGRLPFRHTQRERARVNLQYTESVCVCSQFSSSAVHISLLEFCDTDEFPLIQYENHKIQRFANARIRRIFAKRCEFCTVRVDKGTKCDLSINLTVQLRFEVPGERNAMLSSPYRTQFQ